VEAGRVPGVVVLGMVKIVGLPSDGTSFGYLVPLASGMASKGVSIMMQKISPCFWCDGNAEELARFYVSIFKNSKLGEIMRWPPGYDHEDKVLTVTFELEGRTYLALNGGPEYKFTPALSLSVDCESQEEVDTLWEKLLAGGGAPVQCGWLTDKFGVSWQIVPRELPEMLADADRKRAGRVMAAMMKMVKLDIASLRAAYQQR